MKIPVVCLWDTRHHRLVGAGRGWEALVVMQPANPELS